MLCLIQLVFTKRIYLQGFSRTRSRAQGEAPVNGGAMGWLGEAGMYVPGSVLDAAWANGDAMEYYRSYDARVMAKSTIGKAIVRLARALEVLRQHEQDREYQRRAPFVLRDYDGREQLSVPLRAADRRLGRCGWNLRVTTVCPKGCVKHVVAVVQLYIARWLVELHPPTWPTVKMGAFGSRLPAGWALRGLCVFRQE